MSRRVETKIETIEHKVNIIVCDICGKEVSYLEAPIFESDFQVMPDISDVTKWWKKPLDRIVGVINGCTVDGLQHSPDFEVHVGCVYELIKKAVKK